MAKDLLLEIGLEEMPVHVVTPNMKQLEEKTAKFLDENQLTYDTIEMFSTPCCLATKATNIPERQVDSEEEVRGLAKKIALDVDGDWMKAAEGFVRGQGLMIDAITFRESKGVEYVYITKYTYGKETKEVLTSSAGVIKSLTFSVMTYWTEYDLECIRPVHWIVALLDDEIIPSEILGTKTDRASRGYRFPDENVTPMHAKEYEEGLNEQLVTASP